MAANAAQPTAAYNSRRSQVRCTHTAAPRKIAIGACTATYQRHGNCSIRSLGTKCHTGNEIGSCKNSTVTGIAASTTHHARSFVSRLRFHAISMQASASASMVAPITETRNSSTSCRSRFGSACRANIQLVSTRVPGSSVAPATFTQLCSAMAGSKYTPVSASPTAVAAAARITGAHERRSHAAPSATAASR